MRRILIAEDDEDLRAATRFLLEMNGFTVYEAGNGRVALDKVGTIKPDLLLIDLMMPIMDGGSLCRALRGDPATADIPVIVLSGRNDVQECASQCGALEALQKPVDFDLLLEVISRHLPSEKLGGAT